MYSSLCFTVSSCWLSDPSVGKFSWRRAWQSTPVFLSGEPPWTEESSGLIHGVTIKHSIAQYVYVGFFHVGLRAKNPAANAGDIRYMGSIPGSGRSPGGGHGSPLQYSFLKSPMDRGAWRATVHRVTKSQTQMK